MLFQEGRLLLLLLVIFISRLFLDYRWWSLMSHFALGKVYSNWDILWMTGIHLSEVISTVLTSQLCCACHLESWAKFSKSLGGIEIVEKDPDFLHLAATTVFRVPQLTANTPKKCLRSWGLEVNEEGTIWKQLQNITSPWFSQYQETRDHQEKNNRAGKILLNATVQPFSKMKNSRQHGILVSASYSLRSL